MNSRNDVISRLEGVYRAIDAAYAEAARRTGFSCDGCDGEKCCTVDLILHTFSEMLYLKEGFAALEASKRTEVLDRCRTVLKEKERDPAGQGYRNAVCVLNFGGRCLLYPYRPMICRLSGIPHTIRRPDGRMIRREGCPRYQADIQPANPHLVLDRTGFYRNMAELEMDMVRWAGRRANSRTIAEVLYWQDPDMDPDRMPG